LRQNINPGWIKPPESLATDRSWENFPQKNHFISKRSEGGNRDGLPGILFAGNEI
jgi:hypothetical protein